MWHATVRAKQNGPIFVHHFEGEDIGILLYKISDGLDLSRADSVSIEFERLND